MLAGAGGLVSRQAKSSAANSPLHRRQGSRLGGAQKTSLARRSVVSIEPNSNRAPALART